MYTLAQDVPHSPCLVVNEAVAFGTESQPLTIQVDVEYTGRSYLI